MNKLHDKNDFVLTYQIGNILVFEKTGVIPQYLRFYSKNLKRSWRITLKDAKQQGVLKMKGIIFFNYFYDDSGCRMERVVDGVVLDEWMIEEFVMEIRD
jgi:hypothetical protein